MVRRIVRRRASDPPDPTIVMGIGPDRRFSDQCCRLFSGNDNTDSDDPPWIDYWYYSQNHLPMSNQQGLVRPGHQPRTTIQNDSLPINLVKQCIDELIRIERHEIINRFTETDQFHWNSKFRFDSENDTALGRAIEFR